ncbi:hypothetical protein LOCC1_G008694 [Lachnellula occidentalis]|uniref:DUF4048 domain-containing protein n=1 Tax=Lachnellula occidentalis TaxID=215460 RepID=A0A8H8REB2_9HELO|nr:hypothetical protein LOCC1_G008694 [Lachnellula occidentalis]
MIIQRTSFFPLLDHEAAQFTNHTICTMEGHKRRTSIDPASVESILTSGVPGQAADPPSPHIGTSPSRTHFAMDPPSQPASRHSRTMSFTPLRPNRLSLSFPVATNRNSIESARHTPTSSISTSIPSTPPETIPTPSPADPSGFLNALAGQERKVLELKEELGKAEADLSKLKRQWAVHEAHKKKAEIRHLEQLQPLQTAGAGAEGTKFNEDGTIMTRQSAEWDRRKAFLSNINTKESRGSRVFSGAHTRTLSLLSPERSNCPRPFPPVREASSEIQSQASFPRSTTMPDTSQGITRVSTLRARPLSYQGGITHGAKQVAEDMRTGLWTFLEDLRQATVGDEIANSAANRGIEQTSKEPIIRKSSKSSLLGADKIRSQKSSPRDSPRASPRTWDSLTGGDSVLLDAAEKLLSDNQAETKTRKPLPKPAKKSRTLSLAAPALDDDDDWSNWDSPAPKSPRWSGSTTVSEDLATPLNENINDPVQIAGQSDNAGSSTSSKREDLQWPALDKLTPGNLKRTVSTIMQEWEKGLTPPPGEEGHSRKDLKQKMQEEEDEVLLMSR